MISADPGGVVTLSYTCLIPFSASRPFLPVLFIPYQRDKHLKKATVPARSSAPASCSTSRLSAVRSCSSTRRLSRQVRAPTVPSPCPCALPVMCFLLIPLRCSVASSLLGRVQSVQPETRPCPKLAS